MKKLIAALLTLAMLVGVVPAVLAANDSSSAEPKTMNALVLGDKATRSGFEYLYKIFEAEGYDDICLGFSYLPGGSISDYADGLAAGTTYTFGRNERDYWESATGFNVKALVEDRDWDYIVLQTNVDVAGDAKDIAAAVNKLVPYIKQYKPDAKIGWHINWGNRGIIGATMFQEIADGTRNAILSNDKIDFVVPAGTAVMNVASSFMGSAMYDNSTDMNHLGEFITGYAWYAALTGKKLDELKFDEAILVYLSSAERKTIAEAINNAMKNPCAITQATYKTEPTQYNVSVNGEPGLYMVGDTVTITAKEETNGKRAFLNWTAEEGNVTFKDAKALTTTFKVPAQDVKVKAVYEDEIQANFQVGWGRVDVTPDERNFPEGVTGINLAGNFDTATRISTGTRTPEDRLYVTAVAVSDGKQTNVVMTTDFIRVPTAWSDTVQEICYEKYGLPHECLSISATHTHSAPDIGDAQGPRQPVKQCSSDPGSKNYWYYLVWRDSVVEAVGQALEDLSPVEETKIGTTNVPGVNWVRHWRVKVNTTGHMNGVNFTTDGAANKGYVRDADQELQVVRFVREGKKDVVMLNFQAHPTSFGGSGGNLLISADWCGVLYRTLEASDEDCLAAFYQGAAGNIMYTCNMNSVKEKWNPATDIYDHGKKLADHAMEVMEHMTTVKTDVVKSQRQQFIAFERDYTVTREIEQDVVTIGDSIAICTAGYEMYDSTGMYVKENSPYEVTFIIENAQGHEYMPDWQACHYEILGSPQAYENWESCHNEVPGTAEDLGNGLVAMLNNLYESK